MEGLYAELQVAAREIARGYYGWREGGLQTLRFKDDSQAAISPELNAGSVAVQVLLLVSIPPPFFLPTYTVSAASWRFIARCLAILPNWLWREEK